MAIRRHTQRSTVSISNRVNSANLAIIYSTPTKILEYLSVAGGGAGGYYQLAGGGGAGGYLTGNIDITGITGKVITITVGAGGAPSTQQALPGGNGSNSNISASFIGILEAVGGGGGGSRNNSTPGGGANGQNGGSGGGGGFVPSTGGAGYPGQGYPGATIPGAYLCGSGGGAGGAGIAFDGASPAPNFAPGGVGLQSSISGTAIYRAGGGGFGRGNGGQSVNPGGLGGGGAGGQYQDGIPSVAGLANYGGGGGGAGPSGDPGGAGGSGVVILRYANSFANASYTGSNVVYSNTGGYHTYRFYTSGTITI